MMEGLFRLAKRWFTRLRWVLISRKWERLIDRRFKELCTRTRSADQILAQEYENLVKEFEREDDPIRRYQILIGIQEIEKVLEKRQLIMNHLKF